MNPRLVSSALALVAVLALARPVLAANDIHVRGTVVSLEGTILTVRTREGPVSVLMLKPDWKVTGLAKASVDDIKPGDFVGVASLPKTAGGDGALEVVILPPAMKGAGEGSYPWDVKPESTMTNGTVTAAVTGVDGRNLTVLFKGQQKTISVAAATPIVTLAPATPTDLKPGATVFVPAERETDGTLGAGFVVVGTNGVVPPM
jgi:hypothetical protein